MCIRDSSHRGRNLHGQITFLGTILVQHVVVWSSPAVSGVSINFHRLRSLVFRSRSAETYFLVCFPCSRRCDVNTDPVGTNTTHIPPLNPVLQLNICISSVFSGSKHGQVIGGYASLRSFPSPLTLTKITRYFVQTLEQVEWPLGAVPELDQPGGCHRSYQTMF